jgi:hypothetical protein
MVLAKFEAESPMKFNESLLGLYKQLLDNNLIPVEMDLSNFNDPEDSLKKYSGTVKCVYTSDFLNRALGGNGPEILDGLAPRIFSV